MTNYDENLWELGNSVNALHNAVNSVRENIKDDPSKKGLNDSLFALMGALAYVSAAILQASLYETEDNNG